MTDHSSGQLPARDERLRKLIQIWKSFIFGQSVFERPSLPLLSLCPQESQVFALLVSQSAATRPPSAMAGYESAFQAIDETIADCCLRELPWEFSANIWRADPNTNARCVIRIILFSVLSFSPRFLPTLKHFPFQNSLWLLFPQNSFSTFCHQQKECTVSSLAGLVCQKGRKKKRPAFAKSSSVLCRMPRRKSAD